MRRLKNFFIILWLAFVAVVIFNVPKASAESASHVVISEVQIGGQTSKDEFIELFNPTGQAVNLKDWKLAKKTAGGNESNLLSAFPDLNIPVYGLF